MIELRHLHYVIATAELGSFNRAAASFNIKQWGVFLQDTWQVTDNLSVQYGVRVDIPLTSDKPLYNAKFAADPIASSYDPVTHTGTQAGGGFGRTNQTTINGNRVCVNPIASESSSIGYGE